MHDTITLPNGAVILCLPISGVRSAALGFFVGVGSRHERVKENGAAHFIEHMVFKGTARRTAGELAREMDAIGGQVNAYTTKEHTCFYARCLDQHLDRAADLLMDMLFSSRFSQEDVETERSVILEEIGMYEDAPEDLVAERLAAAVYKNTPLARPILGKPGTLATMTGDWLRTWQAQHYCPGNLVVALAGSFTQAQVDTLIQRLSALTPGPAPITRPASYRPAVTVRRKAIEQNHLLLAFPGLTYLDPRRYQIQLLNSILGGGCSSRLFQEVREKRGLCYSVYSYAADHADTGLMGIYTAVNPEQESAALQAVRETVADFAACGPTQEELDRAREQAKSGLLMGLESVQARMSHMGSSQLLYGRVRSTQEALDGYDAVTREQLWALAEEIFRFDAMSLSAVGRVRRAEEYQNWITASQLR